MKQNHTQELSKNHATYTDVILLYSANIMKTKKSLE